MTQTLTTEAMQEIYEAAVHSEASGSQEAEFELLCKLEDVGGTGATIRTLIDIARAANREAQPVFFIEIEGDDWINAGRIDGNTRPDLGLLPDGINYLYAAPPAPVVNPAFTGAPAVPDGCCIMPLTLTAANGAKGELSGEFKVSRTVRCHECGGEGCDDCADAGEFEEEITVPWDTIKDIYRAAVDTCRASMLSHVGDATDKVEPVMICDKCGHDADHQGNRTYKCDSGHAFHIRSEPVSQGYKLVPVEPTPKQWAAGVKAMDAGMDKVTLVYKAMLAAAPKGGNG